MSFSFPSVACPLIDIRSVYAAVVTVCESDRIPKGNIMGLQCTHGRSMGEVKVAQQLHWCVCMHSILLYTMFTLAQ